MDTLNVGTKEVFVIDLADRLESIADLTPYNVEQKVVTENEQDTKQDWTTVLSATDMRVEALIDTDTWDEGIYKLYVRINIPPELPILGPFEFGIS